MYAIADISYCAAYAVGPIIAGHIVEEMGFTALNLSVAILSLAYAPALYYLRGFNAYQNYDEEADVSGGGVIRYDQRDIIRYNYHIYIYNIPLIYMYFIIS